MSTNAGCLDSNRSMGAQAAQLVEHTPHLERLRFLCSSWGFDSSLRPFTMGSGSLGCFLKGALWNQPNSQNLSPL